MAEIRKSFASDAAAYAGGIDLRDIASAEADALYGAMTNKKGIRPATPITETAVTGADVSAKGTAIDIGNSIHVCLDVEFTTPGGSVTIALAKYDTAGNYCGLTNSWSFQSYGLPRNGAAGKYCSGDQPFDVGNASWVRPVVLAINDTSVDIFVTVL